MHLNTPFWRANDRQWQRAFYLFDVSKDQTVNWREFWKYTRLRERFANFQKKDNQSSDDDEDEKAPVVDANAPSI